MADSAKAPILQQRLFRILIWAAQGTVAVVLLWRLFSNPDFRAGTGELLRNGDWRWAFAGIACGGISIAANIVRWRIFLSIQGINVRWRRLGPVFLMGTFFNLFLPGVVGGEAINALYLMRDHPGKRAPILLSIAADHLSGLLALVVGAAVFASARAGLFMSEPVSAAAFGFMWIVIGGAILLMVVSFVMTHRHVREKVPKRMPGRDHFMKLAACFQLFVDHWKHTLLACTVSFVVLYAFFGAFYCAGRAFGAPLDLLDIFSVMPVVDVVTMVPVSISGLGVREAVMRELLAVLAGIPAAQAVLLSLAGFSFTAIWGIAGGLLFPFIQMRAKKN